MNRVINNPDLVVEDMLRGILAAHPELRAAPGNPRVVSHAQVRQAGRVGIVTGGGSGHEPAFIGYVGRNLVDAVAIGEIFSSPTAKSFFDAFKAADSGAGVACLYGNYAGDNMNVKMAIKLAEREGIRVRTVVANDDAASAPKDEIEKRRGVAGEIVMWKVGGARAAQGASLDEVVAAARKAVDATRSIGIGLSACTIPAVGKANFVIKDGEMEVGIGHHGEPGILVQRTVPAKDMAKLMLDKLLPDLPFARGDKVSVLLSGLGATPLMEQYVLYAEVADCLREAGIELTAISPAEEARLVREAVFAAAGGRFAPRAIIDLGGGSLEISFLRGRKVERALALPLGTVRLMEMFDQAGSFTPESFARLRRYIMSMLRSHGRAVSPVGRAAVVACGGNAEALALPAGERQDRLADRSQANSQVGHLLLRPPPHCRVV